MAKNFYIQIIDYLAFIVVLILATVIPLWSQVFRGKKTRTKADYVFATGTVSMIPMMLSIARGALGVRSFLGFPSEQFYRGAGMWETIYGMVNSYPIIALVFIPVYFNLKATSVYQYIELRFKNKLVRYLTAGSYILRVLCNQGVTVFTPTIAIHTIMGVPIWVSLIGITIISIIFNLLGGLKQAITADVIQMIVTVAVSFTIIIQAIAIAGGITNVYEENRNSGRLNFFNFTGDLTVRVDTTSAWLGQLFMSVSLFGCQQNFVQRYLSMKSVKQVTRMLLLNVPVLTIFFSLSWFVGMCIYSVYSDCDPYKSGYTKSTDAILPFYVEDKLSYIPGLMGIFLSTLFNSALILNVSSLNSLATVTWEDFLSHRSSFKEFSDKKQLHFIKILGSFYGLLILGVGLLVQFSSGVIESAQLMSSATTGPLLGVFLLAFLIPFANWKGASSGMIISHLTTLLMIFGHFLSSKTDQAFIKTSIEGCTNETFSSHLLNSTKSMLINTTDQAPKRDTRENITNISNSFSSEFSTKSFFDISYMYYSLFGTSITFLVGILISLFTISKEDIYETKYLHPFIYKITKQFPGYEKLFIQEDNCSKSTKIDMELEITNNLLDDGHNNQTFDENNEHLKNEVDVHPKQILSS